MNDWYERRKQSLDQLRYPSYAAYLQSSLWRAIRGRVLNRCRGLCEVCKREKPTEVHHRSYTLPAMLGKRLDFLVGCCRDCHERAEFDAGRKTMPSEANRRMGAAAHARGHVLFGLCSLCRKNPTRKHKVICGRCERDRVPQPAT